MHRSFVLVSSFLYFLLQIHYYHYYYCCCAEDLSTAADEEGKAIGVSINQKVIINIVDPVGRPVFVLFGSSIIQFSFSNSGWGAILQAIYARKISGDDSFPPLLLQDFHYRDGVHLSSDGSQIVVQEILKVLKEVDWEPSPHWKSLPTEFAGDSSYDFVVADGKSTISLSEYFPQRY